MPTLACMITKQMMCLKQTQSLLYFATVQRWKSLEHWINIQVSNIVVKWYTSSHEKGFWNSLKQSLRGVHWQRCSWKFCKNLQGNTCTRGNLFKKRLWHMCFLWILRYFHEHLFLLNTPGQLLLNSLFRRFFKVMVKIRAEY